MTSKVKVNHPEKSYHETKVGIWRLELKQNHREMMCTGLLLIDCSVCFCVLLRTTCRVICALSPQSWVKKMFHRNAYMTIWWGHYLNWQSPFAADSSLCEVDLKKKNWYRTEYNSVKLRHILFLKLKIKFKCEVKFNCIGITNKIIFGIKLLLLKEIIEPGGNIKGTYFVRIEISVMTLKSKSSGVFHYFLCYNLIVTFISSPFSL